MYLIRYLKRRIFFRNLVQCYKDFFGDGLFSIILFGSQARMDFHRGSDYDIFIIVEDLPSSPLKRLFMVRQPLIARFEERVCTVSKTTKEFESGFPSLYLDLALDGKILYDKNKYFKKKGKVIKKIIRESGLIRRIIGNEFIWEWIKAPIGGWSIDWSGFHALSR